MKNSLNSCKVFFLSVALVFAGAGLTIAQSLDEILETRPETSQPIVEPPGEPAAQPTKTADSSSEPTDKVDAIRRKIVEHAGSKVGTVHNKAGEDGHKIGWQHLKEFYEGAYQLQNLETQRPGWLKDIKAIGKKVNDWCGIFCVWAWQKAGLPVHWNTRVIGCKYRGQKSMLAPGDIVIIKKSVNPYNHHCLVKSIDGNQVQTIDGNQGTDSIQTKTRKLDDIEIFYSVAEAAGSTVKPNPAVSNGNSTNGAGQAAKPQPGSMKPQNTTTPPSANPASSTSTRPSSASTASNNGKPSPVSEKPLTEKEIQQLIDQVLKLIRITLGQFF